MTCFPVRVLKIVFVVRSFLAMARTRAGGGVHQQAARHNANLAAEAVALVLVPSMLATYLVPYKCIHSDAFCII